ncbi:MAG TPA: VanW family protein, partial [Aeromicrobium sp.]|nr:VanW family protein [Aeromicrobium sp.]
MIRRHRARRALLLAVILLGLLYVAGWVVTGRRMPAHAAIGGVDVGGKSPTDAAKTLRTKLASRADEDVVLTHGKQRFTLDPDELGLELDVKRSVTAAGGTRSFDPRDMAALLVGERNTDIVVRSDRDAMKDAVARIARDVDVKVVEAQITFTDGKAHPRKPVAGRVVLRSATAQAIADAYLVTTKPTPVPTSRIEPAVDQAGLDRALKDIGQPAVSAPVILRAGGKSYELPVSAYAPALSVRVSGGAMKLVLDAEALAKPLTDSATGIGQKAVNARIDIVDGRPKIYPGKPGVSLRPEEMARTLPLVLTKSGRERSLTISTKVVEPEFTTEEAEKLNIKEKMGAFTTNFPYAEYRNINQSRAAELIDGTMLSPGETFSLNSVVGQRTKANGFVKGFVINGGVFREEMGGGVSQVATTTYNAAFF